MPQLVEQNIQLPVKSPSLSMHTILQALILLIDYEVEPVNYKSRHSVHESYSILYSRNQQRLYQHNQQPPNTFPRPAAVLLNDNRYARAYIWRACVRWHRRVCRNTQQGLRPASRSTATHQHGSAAPVFLDAGASAHHHLCNPSSVIGRIGTNGKVTILFSFRLQRYSLFYSTLK